MESAQETIKKAGLDYNFYLLQCDALKQELEKGRTHPISTNYLNEKLRKISQLVQDLEEETTRQQRIKTGQ